MSTVTKVLLENAKAVAGFVAGLIIIAVQDVIEGRSPWPGDLAGWAKYLATALISGVVVWVTGNKLTQKQVVKGAIEQGITVVTTEAVQQVTGRVNDAVQDAISNIPGAIPAAEIVDAARKVSRDINSVIKGVATNFDLDLKDVL